MANSRTEYLNSLRKFAIAATAAVPAYFALPAAAAQAGSTSYVTVPHTVTRAKMPINIVPANSHTLHVRKNASNSSHELSPSFLMTADLLGHEVKTGRVVGMITDEKTRNKTLVNGQSEATHADGDIVFDHIGPNGRIGKTPDGIEKMNALLGHPMEVYTSPDGRITSVTRRNDTDVGASGLSGRQQADREIPKTTNQYDVKPLYENGSSGKRVIDSLGNRYDFHSASSGSASNSISTFSASQISQAVCSGTCGTDQFSNLKNGQQTNITFQTKNGQTVTAAVTKEGNKFAISGIGAAAVSTQLKGDSTQIDSKNDKGITIESGNLASFFANDATGVGRIQSVATGKTQAELLTVRSNANGEQQVWALVTNQGNGNYQIVGTKATPTSEIKSLINYTSSNCICVIGNYKGHKYTVTRTPQHKYQITGVHFKTREEIKIFLQSVSGASNAASFPSLSFGNISIDNSFFGGQMAAGNGARGASLGGAPVNPPPPSIPQATTGNPPPSLTSHKKSATLVGKCTSFACTCFDAAVVQLKDFFGLLLTTLNTNMTDNTKAVGGHTGAITVAAKQAHDDAVQAHQDAKAQLAATRKGDIEARTANRLLAGVLALLAVIATAAVVNLFRRRSTPILPPPGNPPGGNRNSGPGPGGPSPRSPNAGGTTFPVASRQPAPVPTPTGRPPAGSTPSRSQPIHELAPHLVPVEPNPFDEPGDRPAASNFGQHTDHVQADHHLSAAAAALVALAGSGLAFAPNADARPLDVYRQPAISEPVQPGSPSGVAFYTHHAAPNGLFAEAVNLPTKVITPVMKTVASKPVVQPSPNSALIVAFRNAQSELTGLKKNAAGSSYSAGKAFATLADAAVEAFQKGDYTKASQAATWLLLRDKVVGLSASKRNDMVALVDLVHNNDSNAVRGAATEQALRTRVGDRRFEYV